MIKENAVGAVTENDLEEFAEGILGLLENPKLLNECGQRGVELVKNELGYLKSTEQLRDTYYK